MKNSYTTLVVLLLILGMALPAYAQFTVSGTVTDMKTGESLPGVNITVKGMSARGTTTDINGEYLLQVPSPQDTLVFSFVGYVTQEVPIRERNTINVALNPSVLELEGTVVIGYGTQERGDNTGSVSVIGESRFNEGAITSPQELFLGKLAGVNVTPNDGAPGSGAVIRIRGGSSLSASNEPLFVIDGIPMDEGGIAGMRNPLNTINPGDIESISILKDASATAIYGARASNGVVIITTKQGVRGQPLTVDYSVKTSLQNPHKRLELLTPGEFREAIETHFGQNGTQLMGDSETDWQDRIYSNTINHDHNLSLRGSYNQIPYRFSVGFSGNGGILKTDQLNRLTGSLSLNPTFMDDRLKVALNLKGVQVNNRFANRGAIGSAAFFDPTQPVTVEGNEAFGGYFVWTDLAGNPIGIAPANPMALLDQTNDKSTVYRSIGNLKVDYELPFVDNLRANLNVGYDYSDTGEGLNTIQDNAAFAYNSSDPRLSGLRTEYEQKKKNELLDFYLKYDTDLSTINSRLDVTAGYSYEHHYEDGFTLTTNFNTSDTTAINQDTDYATEYYLISFFGRVNYVLNEKYLFTATLRQDGTSRFSRDNRWGLFPSAAFAWKMHEENFLQDVELINELKLRLSYGVTGQERIGLGNYPYLPRYTRSQSNARYQFGDEFVFTLRPEGYNANLKWEESTTYNAGIDYSVLNQRLFGSLEAYYRKTKDLLNEVPVPAGTNFTNRILSNIGTLEVKGVEFSVTGRAISNENTYLELSLNATRTLDEITKLTTVDDPNFIGVEAGGISGGVGNTIQIHSVGHPRNSFFVLEQVYDQEGNPIEGLYVDQNGDGIINDGDKYRYKKPTPDVTLGFSSRLNHKNWDASFSARANIGNYVYNNVASNSHYSVMRNSTGFLRNASAAVKETNFFNAQYFSDYFVEEASFLRMDNITVGYTFNQFMGRDLTLRLSAAVQNAFVITNYSGIDPEVFGGIDNNIYPRPRIFVLGLNLNFN